jgi:hypothetical protein
MHLMHTTLLTPDSFCFVSCQVMTSPNSLEPTYRNVTTCRSRKILVEIWIWNLGSSVSIVSRALGRCLRSWDSISSRAWDFYCLQLRVPRILQTSGEGSKTVRAEALHSSPCSAEIRYARSYTSTPQYVFMMQCVVCLFVNKIWGLCSSEES